MTNGYEDDAEAGVFGYGGELDIRPPYQREFVYKDDQRNAVIDTLTKYYPMNVMYWSVKEDASYKIIDGQQRTISICQYVEGDFSFNDRYFHNLQDDEQEKVLDYRLTVYLCSGTDSEKLEWFKIINIAGAVLTKQELRNSVYAGSWLSDAKRYFSKTGCAAYGLGHKQLDGAPIRQDYLETTLKWISKDAIEDYMGSHEPNANELWAYFQSVIKWVEATFPQYREPMKGLSWGTLYNEFYSQKFDPQKLEEEITKLMQDEDVSNKKGIYSYVLTRKEKHLNIRSFTNSQKSEAYERQKGICAYCKKHFTMNKMEADHITPWHEGGETVNENCQMLCKDCNRRKSGK